MEYWPNHFEQVSEIELDDEPYQFNLIGVWLNKNTNELVWGADSGCSCPSPWERTDWDSLATLTPGEWKEVTALVKQSKASMAEKAQFFAEVEYAMHGGK